MIFIPVPFHGLMIVKQSSILFFFSLNVLSTNLLLRAPKPHIWIVCSSKSLNYSILTKKIKTAVWCDINPTVEKIRARERTGQGHMYEDESAQQHRRSRVSRQLKRSNQLQSSRSGRGKRSINITGGWSPPPPSSFLVVYHSFFPSLGAERCMCYEYICSSEKETDGTKAWACETWTEAIRKLQSLKRR